MDNQYKIIVRKTIGKYGVETHYVIWDKENQEEVDGAPTLLDAKNLLAMYQ